MLKQLTIHNYKLITHLECTFDQGLTALTGETGAGKSVLLGALSTLFKGPDDNDLFLNPEEPASISAVFSLPPQTGELIQRLEEIGLSDGEDEIILRRRLKLGAQGRLSNRIYINDQPTSNHTATEIFTQLLEFVDQHQQQILRRPADLLDLLDNYAGLQEEKRNFRLLYTDFTRAEKEFARWQEELGLTARQMDYFQHQLKELNDSDLKAGEEEDLLGRRRLYQQAGRLRELAHTIEELCAGSDNCLLDQCYLLQDKLEEIRRRDDQAPLSAEPLTAVIDCLQDIQRHNRNYLAGLEIDENEIDANEARLALIERLQRKFATDVAGLLALRNELEEKITSFADRDQESQRRREMLSQQKEQLLTAAASLEQKRKQAADTFSREVENHLRDLKLAQASLVIEVAKRDLGATGSNEIRFLFSANPGQPPGPIDRIASGGELSRLLLAVKTAIASQQARSTLIFDEVDTGLGGATAGAVGRKLAAIAAWSQVITVTHLPQVAAYADSHYLINKEVRPAKEKGSVKTTINLTKVEQESDIIAELARMGSGGEISPAALDHARGLRREAEKGKTS